MKKLICSVLIVLVVFVSFPISAFSLTFSDENTIGSFNFPDTSDLYVYYHNLGYNIMIFYDVVNDRYHFIASQDHTSNSNPYQLLFNGDTNHLCVAAHYNLGSHYFHYNSNYGEYYWDSSMSEFEWYGDYYTFSPGEYTDTRIVYDITNWILLCYEMAVPQTDNNDDEIIRAAIITSYDGIGNYSVISDPSALFYFNSTGQSVNSLDNSGGSSGSVSVDMTVTNNLLSGIRGVVDDISDDVADIKTALSSLSVLTTINSNISSIKSNTDTIVSGLSTLNSSTGDIYTSVSSMVTTYISPIKTKIDSIDTVLGGIRSDMATQSSSVVTSLGDIQTAIAAVPTGINSRLDSVILQLQKIYISLSSVIGYQGDNTLFSVVLAFKTDFNDFIDIWSSTAEALFTPFIDPEEENFSIYDNMVAAFNGKFETLYNVILYGDRNGAAAQEHEQMKMKQFQADLDSITARLDDAPSAINSNSADVSAEISVFTQFYEGITALNAALSSVLYFGLIVIFIKKVVGR